MLSKMASVWMLVDRILGVKFIAPATIKSVDVEAFVYPVFGVLQKND
jgi:hypothetical protein